MKNIFNKLKRGFGLGNEEETASDETNTGGSATAATNGHVTNGAGANHSTGNQQTAKKTTENKAAENVPADDYARFLPGYTPPATSEDAASSGSATTGNNVTTGSVTSKSANTKASFVPSTPMKRDAIIGFILNALKPYVDEKGLSVQGLKFYIHCTTPEETEAARVALYLDKPDLFKTEHLERKLINHFIQLERGWYFEAQIVKDQLPEDCQQQGQFGVKIIQAGGSVALRSSKARLLIMVGQAEQHEYLLDPIKQQKFYIGRSKSPQLPSGKIQLNDIVFVAKDEPGFNEIVGMANLHVSRNHAYIQYDARTDRYLLYPDKGGLPENGNKIKVHTADDKIKFLNLYGVAHPLQEGDQIELGGEAILMYRRLSQ